MQLHQDFSRAVVIDSTQLPWQDSPQPGVRRRMLERDGGQDFRIMGLKREKLRIKDRISWLASHLTPDIIA